MRQELLRGVRVPHELVNDAFRTLARQINAKTTKYFADKGIVTDERELDDNDAQLRASDQIIAIAGLYAPRSNAQSPSQGFALEIDPTTGVIRLVVGSPASIPVPEGTLHNGYYRNVKEIDASNQLVAKPVKGGLLHESPGSCAGSVPSASRRVAVGSGSADGQLELERHGETPTPPTPQTRRRGARKGIPLAGGTQFRSNPDPRR